MAMAAATPELFSPSLFLDLPPTPTPHNDNDHGDSESDDNILAYISRMLMEEDMEDQFFYHFPDHPALLQAQQPFAQILSDAHANAATSSGSGSANSSDVLASTGHGNVSLSKGTADGTSFISTAKNGGTSTVSVDEAKTSISLPAGVDGGLAAMASAFFNGQTDDGNNLNSAFLKGMEEASKFLPANTNLLANLEGTSSPVNFFRRDSKPATATRSGRKNRHDEDELEAEAGRSSKLMVMVPDQEETGAAGEMMDEIMLRQREMCVKGLEELRIAMSSEKKTRKAARGRRVVTETTTVDLRTMLLRCAEAVATGDRRGATELLKQIKRHSSLRGDAMQRLAHCFAEGLEARLAGTGSELYRSLVAQRTSTMEFLKGYKLFFVACPFMRVKFYVDNQTVMAAVAGRSRLHILDYGVQFGFQWSGLLQQLACREGGPPEVRITGVDKPQPGFRPAFQIEETGRRLSNCARKYGVPFKFRAVAAKWETVCAEDLDIDPGEVLVVNTQRGLGDLMDVDGDGPSPRDVFLGNIRKMRPDVFIHWVVNGGFGAPFFLTRFREALFYYSAHFDVLDATIPREYDDRMLLEQNIFGPTALNVVACEGGDRVDRPETYKQWQVRNQRAGLRQLPLDLQAVNTMREKMKSNYHHDFDIDEDGRWLLQGWKGRVLSAMSTWVANDIGRAPSPTPHIT